GRRCEAIDVRSNRPRNRVQLHGRTVVSGGGDVRRFGVRDSVFARLVAVMMTMAASLLLLVGGFFLLIVSPAVGASIDLVLEEEARTIAAASPDVHAAGRPGRRVRPQIPYQGPAGPPS